MALRDACASKNCSPFAPDEFWPAPPPDAGNICSFVWWREHHRTALSAFSRWWSVCHPLQCTGEVESAGPATIVRNPSRCYCVRKSTLSLFTHIMFRKLQQLNSKTITRTYDHIHYRFAFTIGVIVTSHCHLKLQLWWSIWLINVTCELMLSSSHLCRQRGEPAHPHLRAFSALPLLNQEVQVFHQVHQD